MTKRNHVVSVGLLLLGVSVMAQSGFHRAKARDGAEFDGTWIVDFQAAMPTR